MILSVSRRTDIPSYYSAWFLNRLKEGFVYVRNPFNANQISRIELNPLKIECIVFWTKNPKDLIDRLDEIDALGYKYYFQFTVTSYDKTIEPNIPKKEDVIETFQKLSEKIGSEKIIWRYDPILLAEKYPVEYHLKWFDFLADQLKDHTHKCIFSFIDMYRKCERNLTTYNIEKVTSKDKKDIVRGLSALSRMYSLKLESCAQDEDFEKYGVTHSKCIDDVLISNIINESLILPKDKNQRDQCCCATSVDIGTYNTCKNFCRYCYANYSEKSVLRNMENHDKTSPLITGLPTGEEKITERKAIKNKSVQLPLFDDKKPQQGV